MKRFPIPPLVTLALAFVGTASALEYERDMTATTKTQAAREWHNREGRTIVATLLRVEGEVAVLRLANGAVHRYPIENLSDESRAALSE